jgi:hypothetical protein
VTTGTRTVQRRPASDLAGKLFELDDLEEKSDEDEEDDDEEEQE